MKRTELTINHASPERVVLEIALFTYLCQFDAKTIEEAHETSAIKNALHTYNRVRNISHGTHTECYLNTIPQGVDLFLTTHRRVA